MTQRALRIRHYIGTIVAGCSLGGLLLAFELAFLFQSNEARSQDVRAIAAHLSSVEGWQRSVEGWLGSVRASLGSADAYATLEEGAQELLVEVQKLEDVPASARFGDQFAAAQESLRAILKGAKLAAGLAPESPLYAARVAEVRQKLPVGEQRLHEEFARIVVGLRSDLDTLTQRVDERRSQLWTTVGISTLIYAALVLVLWRWVVWRLLRPLQALTEESRRTRDGEAAFRLVPAGPHEVRLLTESLSNLVEGLVAARGGLEAKVRERTLELERANLAKNEFLANMSHEIRTPMTAILGYAELCLAPDIAPAEHQRYAEIIHANGEHLLSVINDILDVSKIEAGRMTVEPTLCAPFEVVSEVRSLMAVRARAKGLELSVENSGPIPEIVRTDPTRLRQILLNLVNNAIKFTEHGGVVLTFSLVERPGGGGELLAFEVRDTGVGMSREQIERIFRPFVQADTSTTRKYGGSGLGLTISQTLARMLGGDLTCHSEPGSGSSFRVTIDPGPLEGVRRIERLPESAPRERSAPILSADPAPKLEGRVLVAEDVAVNRRLVATILERTGIEVSEAENGRIALERALEAQEEGRPFDLIFMDMQMPEMDGYEATRRLRQAGYARPIVALTSHSMSGERQRCLEAGCDDYTTKPIDRQVLLRVLVRSLPCGEPQSAA